MRQYTIGIVIFCCFERKNGNVLKIQTNNSTWFEINSFLLYASLFKICKEKRQQERNLEETRYFHPFSGNILNWKHLVNK